MKIKIVYLFIAIGIAWSCSNETPDDSNIPEEQGFTFEIFGDIVKTISGKTAFFSTSVTKDIFDRDLYTIVISANDDKGDQVNIGITALEKAKGGNYKVRLTIEPPYNGFVNYSEDPNNGKPIYGPIGGEIVLSSVRDNMVTGSIDAECEIPIDTNKKVKVKGTFKALVGSQ